MLKKKFFPAFSGLLKAWQHKSVRIQCALAMITVIVGFFIHLTLQEWIGVILCIGFVLTAELLNTCIERLCDLYSKENDERIAWIKDVSCAAVFISALCALIEAVIIGIHHFC